jgi:adenylate cyclase class 2
MYARAEITKGKQMLEIEIKAKVESLEAIEEDILKRGGRFRKEVTQEDIYFNHPGKDFATTDEALRLRKVEGGFYLTYKGPKIDNLTKTREELKVSVGDHDVASEILKALGFTEVLMVKKKRRYFRLDEYDIMLDNVVGLGSFIEVEKSGAYNPQDLIDFVKDLGIEESETRSYLELLIERKEAK